MDEYLDDLCDSIDAAVFTGDTLHHPAAIEDFEVYLNRWHREIKRIKEHIFNDVTPRHNEDVDPRDFMYPEHEDFGDQ